MSINHFPPDGAPKPGAEPADAFMQAELSELADSFVRETRDLLDEAGNALLVIERDPADVGAINALFRCVHSIKGAAGLFDLPALIHLVHAGEDLLGAMREGELRMDAPTADALLAGFDRVGEWITDFATQGSLPEGSMAIARQLADAYRARLTEVPGYVAVPAWPGAAAEVVPEPLPVLASLPAWVPLVAEDVLAASDAEALVLVEYVPDEACFFSGEDPLRLAGTVPGLVWLDIAPREPWASAAEFDPYACNLRLRIASDAALGLVEDHFRYVPDNTEVLAISRRQLAGGGAEPEAEVPPTLTPLGVEIIEAQARSLATPGRHGQLNDIEAVVRNVCTALGLDCPLPDGVADADALGQAVRELLAATQVAAPEAQATMPDRAGGGLRPALAADTHPERSEAHTERVLRVEQTKVDSLMNLVGELVVAKNALPFLARDAEVRHGSRELSREIKDKYAVIDRIARQLQNAVMDIRMMPVSDLFKRFPRLVRDIARKQDKRIELVIEGETTEADKNIIEALAEPLTHVLRNSLDHGIETSDERAGTGKPPVASIRLRAFQEGDSVVIEVADDGRGIDPERVRAKAVERGLLDQERAQQLNDQQAIQLVFLPGFSTAEQVSDLSGRGVGMDAVRNVVERFGGVVQLDSRQGEGTTVRLKLPLSMAVTRVLTVELGGQLYGIPMELVVETVRIEPAQFRRLKDSEMVILRDQVIPIARLRSILGMELREPVLESVLILRIGAVQVGLVIDDFGTGMDIILKPFAGILANMSGFSGTAVLGDGRVLLVLNLKEIL